MRSLLRPCVLAALFLLGCSGTEVRGEPTVAAEPVLDDHAEPGAQDQARPEPPAPPTEQPTPDSAARESWRGRLAVSQSVVCWVTSERTVRCWGSDDDDWGLLGDGGRSSRLDRSVQALGLEGVVEVTAQGGGFCARTEASTVHCWGLFGSSTAYPRSESRPRRVGPLNDARELSSGTVLMPSGDVLRGFMDGPASVIEGLPPVSRLASLDAEAGCAIAESSRVFCWGMGFLGQDAEEPRQVPELDGVLDLDVGLEFVCGLRPDRTVACFGHVHELVAGPGSADEEPRVVQIPIDDAIEVAVGHHQVCAVRRNGSVRCIGEARYGTLGGLPNGHFVAQQRAGLNDDGTVDREWIASAWGHGLRADVIGATNERTIASSPVGSATCTLNGDGQVRCWQIDHIEPESPHIGLPDFIRLTPDGAATVEPFGFVVDIPPDPVLGQTSVEVQVRPDFQ